MNYRLLALLALVGWVVGMPSPGLAKEKISKEQMTFFESKVRPLLAAKCLKCHGAEKQESGLRVDTLSALLKGGDSGAAVVPGKPDDSLLIEAVKYESFEMPPEKKLSDTSISILTQWVKMGAPWPDPKKNVIRASDRGFTEEDRKWWAIQPIKAVKAPGHGKNWAHNPIDHFVARKLENAKLKPAAQADRYELVRRAYFDLHGLPPTPAQVEAFVNDKRPDAWERLIDQLLESPRYGERWAQHWLDVIRYAESDGYREDAYRPNASKFRDYVIQSFNNDKPFKEFIREQLAGDEIAPDDPNRFIGTAYLRHGVYEWNQRNARMQWDLITDEMTRVTGEVFLGIGIGCAQCHDHKFDPILQKDYYGLRAFFSSVAWPMDKPLATPKQLADYNKKRQAWEEKTKAIRAELDQFTQGAKAGKKRYVVGQFPEDVQKIYNKPESEKTTYEKQLSYLVQRQIDRQSQRIDVEKSLKKKKDKLARYKELKKQLAKFDKLKPKALPTAFVATDIASTPAPTYLYTRTTKTEVAPSFLALLGEKGPQITALKNSTGRRTALANWIAQDSNPLSTRVIVNRVWQRHFGRGIVATPNDFGTLGEPPSHPELLDWLTRQFLAGDWKMKKLHKLIMTSATYQQTARREPSDSESKVDPTNLLLWRFPPQRLDAEQVRDAMLAVSGELKQREGGTSQSGTSPYRSVYVKKLRNRPDEMLQGFDAPLGFDSSPERIATTTPIQSLLLLNGDWTLKRAEALAKRLLDGKKQLVGDDVRQAFWLVFGREPSEYEIKESLAFVKSQSGLVEPAQKPKYKYPNDNGLRPIKEKFAGAKSLTLGDKSLWLQPGSRFERLHVKKVPNLEEEFTVQAVVSLDSLHRDASVNTIISRWNSSKSPGGWNIGVTSTKSRYKPRNLIVQLVGRNFQDEPAYEVIASDLRVPLNKPVYIAVSISAKTSKENPTSGSVTFYLKDLSDPNAKLQTATVETSVVSKIQTASRKIVVGGRDGQGHHWDGQLARLLVTPDALSQDQLLLGKNPQQIKPAFDWTFAGDNGENPAPQTAWLRSPGKTSSASSSKVLRAVTNFCHALFNSNEFLYLH